ncbi:MAG TPA: DUF4192 domain-containing protein [Actinomycetes bacterium]|nr:DUF4192 domain-containing protein [Actinomycetes bacterium]
MSVIPAETVLRLSGPPDVLAALPYLVGFPPTESVVAIGLHGRRKRLRVTLRVDLAGAEAAVADGLVEAPSHPAALAAALSRAGASRVVLVVVTDRAEEGLTAADLVSVLAGELEARRIEVEDAVLARGDRWFSYLCHNPACCPPEGTPLPGDDRVAAELALAGEAPFRSRADVEALVAPEQGIRRQAVEAAVDALLAVGPSGPDAVDERTSLRTAFRTVVSGRPLEAQNAALCLLWLTGSHVRDACLNPTTGPEGEAALRLWCELARLAPADLVSAPATLAAFVALCRGQGALANAALDEALADDPGYTLAQLLRHIATAGIPPSVVRGVAESSDAILAGIDGRSGGQPLG